MKITIFESLAEFPVRAKRATAETKNFLHFLTSDGYFKNKLKELREKYGIPENGYPLQKLYEAREFKRARVEGWGINQIETYNRLHNEIQAEILSRHGTVKDEYIQPRHLEKLRKFYRTLSKPQMEALKKHSRELKEFYADKNYLFKHFKYVQGEFSYINLEVKMRSDLAELVNHYSVPDEYSGSFFLLIAFNAFMNFDTRPEFVILDSKEEILDQIPKYKTPVKALLINKKVSKRQLIEWINSHWDYVEMASKDLPEVPSKRSNLLEISQEIAALREQAQKKYSEISGELSKKYPDDDRVWDEGWVKETYLRYKRMQKEFNKRNIE